MKIIDLRSDTVAQPLPVMKEAFLLSDYAMGKDDMVLDQLQREVANLFDKQSGSFVASRTFGNQCVTLTAMRAGQQIILAQNSHMMQQEGGGLGMISRILTKSIECKEGLMTISGLKNSIRKVKDESAPKTTLFSIQNPTHEGRVYPIQQFNELIKIAKESGLLVHLDGARFFNAQVHYKMDLKQLIKDIDFVTVSLTKGLCVPYGSLVLGPRSFMTKFNVNKRMLGGIFRKMGMFAAMALVSIKVVKPQLYKNHEIALLLAQKLSNFEWIRVDKTVDTNMVFFTFTHDKVDAEVLQKYILNEGIKVDLTVKRNGKRRFMTHHYIRHQEIEKLIAVMESYQKKFIYQKSL